VIYHERKRHWLLSSSAAELLGYLPLALEQAGAYVRETRIALSAYLDRLRQFPALTLARGRPRDRISTDALRPPCRDNCETNTLDDQRLCWSSGWGGGEGI
jgi:hypothetical protein